MKKLLTDTGERIIPEKMKITNELLIEHVARYHFASHYVHGNVLDFACGSGYGTHIIAKNCKDKIEQIVGIDNDEDVIQYAKSTYYHPKSEFILGDVTEPSLPDKLDRTFDFILSFETIEHVAEEKQFLENIYHLLNPGGTLILSTPFGKGRNIPSGSPFHVHQLTVDEFHHLFTEFDYATVDYFFQKGALIVPEDAKRDHYFPLGIAVCKKVK